MGVRGAEVAQEGGIDGACFLQINKLNYGDHDKRTILTWVIDLGLNIRTAINWLCVSEQVIFQ